MARHERHARHAGAGHAAIHAERHARAAAHGHHHHHHHTSAPTTAMATGTTTTAAATTTPQKPPPSAPAGDPAYIGPGGTATAPTTGTWNTAANWSPSGVPANGAALSFGGSGSTAYTSTQDISATYVLGAVSLTSTASVTEIIAGMNFNLGAGSSISQDNTGAFTIQNTFGGQNTAQTLTLTGNNTGLVTLSGIISEQNATHNVSIMKTGTSTFVLSGANTYTGATTISAGTLSANKIVVSGGNSSLGNATSAVILGDATNQGTLSYTGGSATYTRGFTINAGGGQLTNAGSGTLTVSTGGISAGGLFTVGGATNNITINSVISGAGGLTKTGADKLTLNGANTYTGTTTVTAGNVTITNATGLGTGGLTMNGGTLDLNVAGTTTHSVANLSGVSGAIVEARDTGSNSVTATLSVGSDGTSTTYAGVLAENNANGNGAQLLLTKVGSGTLTLSGANTYTGVTTISAGTLSVSSLANGGVASNIGQSTNAAANLVFDGGTLQYTGGSVSTDRNFTINTGKTATINVSTGATNLTISGASTATNGALTKTGSGTLTLTGANLYTGATNINAGTLSLDNNNTTTPRLASTSVINVNNGGTLLLTQSGGTASSDRIGNSVPLTLNGGGTINTHGLVEGVAPILVPATNGSAGMGALTLQNTTSVLHATIDFFTGATTTGSTLAFNGVSGLTSTTFLDIKNWTGTPMTDTGLAANDRLLFASLAGSGLSVNQVLPNVVFTTDAGATLTGGEIIAYGNMFELVAAVPEPSTWVAGALALTSLVACRAGVIGRRVGQRRRISRLVRRR